MVFFKSGIFHELDFETCSIYISYNIVGGEIR